MEHVSRRSNRREFLGAAVPACAMTCLGMAAIPASALAARRQAAPAGKASSGQSPAHVFDQELPRKLTYREMMTAIYSRLIPVILAMDKALGRPKTVELLRATSAEQARGYGRTAAERSGANDMAALRNILINAGEGKLWIVQVVEDTDRVFEIRASECLFAKTFQDGHADGELGYAAVCCGDYAFAEGFNPKMRLVRDKTIMQGHGVCNHRYTLTP